MRKGTKILLLGTESRYLIKYRKEKFHTKEGAIDLTQIKKFGDRITSAKGPEFTAIEPNYFDLMKKFKRGPQIILPKDAGLIITETGIGDGSKVIDAGTGTGWMVSFLSRVVGSKGKVVTYEKSKANYKLAKENFEELGLKNVRAKNGDAYSDIKEKNFDAMILDLAEPWRVSTIKKNIKPGGYVIAYLPQISQVQEYVTFCRNNNILIERVVKVQEREWTFRGRISRPKSHSIGHTAFLIFSRVL